MLVIDVFAKRHHRGMHQTGDMVKVWVKPVAKGIRESAKAHIAELRAELAQAEVQLCRPKKRAGLNALAKANNLICGFKLTLVDLDLTPFLKRRGKLHKMAAQIVVRSEYLRIRP